MSFTLIFEKDVLEERMEKLKKIRSHLFDISSTSYAQKAPLTILPIARLHNPNAKRMSLMAPHIFVCDIVL